jgi:hypothetical protein
MLTIRLHSAAALAVALAFFFTTQPASAARVLFVSDANSDNNIPAVLTADGHTVTVVTNDYAGDNPTLRGGLSGYDVVVWSAIGGDGLGGTHSAAVRTALEAYVSGGGFVFVTAYDSIADPTDPELIALLGGTGSVDVPPVPGACITAENE